MLLSRTKGRSVLTIPTMLTECWLLKHMWRLYTRINQCVWEKIYFEDYLKLYIFQEKYLLKTLGSASVCCNWKRKWNTGKKYWNLLLFSSAKKKKKNQIKCYFKILAALSLFSPETKSDNENGDKAILGIIADWMFLLFFQCSVFHSALNLPPTSAALPSAILRRQRSSDATDSTISSENLCMVQVRTVRIHNVLAIIKY